MADLQNYSRRSLFLAGTGAAIAASAYSMADDLEPAATNSMGDDMSSRTKLRLPVEGDFPSLDGASGWLNSEPLTPASLRGKVVIVEFWTYSCINWLRIQPYVRAWSERYKEHGLVVVGVHTPEFEFEKNLDNIRWAVSAYRVDYAIAVDSEAAIWRAFDNRYWPALYLIDGEGRIRHRQFGEGGYERSEAAIRNLLVEHGATDLPSAQASVQGSGVEAAPDIENLASRETYLGYGRAERLVSSESVVPDKPTLYAMPNGLRLDHWGLSGRWKVGWESTKLVDGTGRIRFRFHARDLNLVMGPAAPSSAVRFRVSIDGEVPGHDSGLDVDEDGSGLVTEQRLYQLVRQRRPVADRTFEIEFLDPGAEVFAFTFG